MTFSEAFTAADTADDKFDEPVPLHPDNGSEYVADRIIVHAEVIWNLPDYSAQYAGGVCAHQLIELLCQKAGLDTLATVPQDQKLTLQRLAVVTENTTMSAALTAVSDAFMLKIETLLTEFSIEKDVLSSRQIIELSVKPAQLFLTYHVDVDV